MPRRRAHVVIGVLLGAVVVVPSRADSLRLLPSSIRLSGAHARQAVVAERFRGDVAVGQIRDAARFSIADPQIARVEAGVVVPLRNGRTKLKVEAGSESADADLVVNSMERPSEWSFRNHVQSVLTKQGCNSGACHGAIAGKNGFRLSLRGFNSEADHAVLTRQAKGRRVDLQDPARSLLLLKPTAIVPHGGGMRLDPASPEYRVLADWLADGAPPPKANDPAIERIEILPSRFQLKPGDRQQLIVLAHFSDGRVEDATRWTKFTSTNAEVGSVGELGEVEITGHGEGSIVAWYLNKLDVATATSPYPNKVDPKVFAGAPRRNFVDEMILEKLQALNLPPSPRASDGEFMRRAFVDTIGTLPTAAEAKAFLADGSSDKRDRLIESLLKRPEFVDYWTYRWSDLLLVNSEKLKPQAMWSYYRWIRNRVAANTPWDRFARELVTATGDTLENGAVNFYILHPDPMELTETISTAFMGMPLNCARCHNHPLEKWTNDQYFGFLNLTSRVRQKSGVGDGAFTVFTAESGDIVQPSTGRVRAPQPLDAAAVDPADRGDRRVRLAAWMTSPDNPYFTRSIVNRVWTNFMGVGLVEKVDDLRLTNPASNERLLSALAKQLIADKYDLKSLMRLILQSEAYARSSAPIPGNEADRRFYSRCTPRRLMAEVLLDGVSQVAGAPTEFKGYPAGWRALQLPDSNVASYFLDRFGRPERSITCDCERTSEPSMVQVLHLSNGDALNRKLAKADNRIGKLLSSNASAAAIVDELFLSALCRVPTAAEKRRLTALIESSSPAERRQAVEDVYWSVLSSREFLFNH